MEEVSTSWQCLKHKSAGQAKQQKKKKKKKRRERVHFRTNPQLCTFCMSPLFNNIPDLDNASPWTEWSVNKNRHTKCAMPCVPRTSTDKITKKCHYTPALAVWATFCVFSVIMRPLQEVFVFLSHGNLLLLYSNINHLLTAIDKEAVVVA